MTDGELTDMRAVGAGLSLAQFREVAAGWATATFADPRHACLIVDEGRACPATTIAVPLNCPPRLDAS